MRLSYEQVEAMAIEIADKAGFCKIWHKESYYSSLTEYDFFEFCFMGYGIKIIHGSENSYLEYQGQKVIVLSRYCSRDTIIDFEWVEILCLIYDKLPLFIEIKELCNDWCKYVGKTYESGNISVFYGERESYGKSDEGVQRIWYNGTLVYSCTKNVSKTGSWIQEVRRIIDDTITEKENVISKRKETLKCQEYENKQTLLNL